MGLEAERGTGARYAHVTGAVAGDCVVTRTSIGPAADRRTADLIGEPSFLGVLGDVARR